MNLVGGEKELGRFGLVAIGELHSGSEIRTLKSLTTKIIIRGTMMKMHNPPHPGEVIRELCLEPMGLSVTRAAEALGVSRKTLSAILNGRASISPEMAVRLSLAFGTSSESWLNQQLQYDLWLAEKSRNRLKVERLSVA